MLRPIDRRVIDRTTIDRRITDVQLDPNIRDLAGLLNVEAAPLMLLPMRLEYRFIPASGATELKRDSINRKIDALGELRPGVSRSRSSLAADRKLRENLIKLRGDTRITLPGATKKVVGEKLYIRWYPDESFSEKGVAPPSDDELTALAHLNTRLGGSAWWDFSNAEVATAWQEFTGNVGVERGIHLKRSEGQPVDANWEARIGRITALPAKVAVYTLRNGKVSLLADGGEVPQNEKSLRSPVSYTPDALTAGNWLHDFDIAIKQGMGVRITDASKIKQAKAADWTIAIGLSGTNGPEELEALFNNRIAAGEFEFLQQDTPTNNSSAQPSPYKQYQSNALDYTTSATDFERNLSVGDDETAASVFAGALGINLGVVRQAINANDLAFADAKAMLTVIGPALLDEALDGTTMLDGVTENEFIEVMAASMVSRGVLPSFRLGANPFGVLPMTQIRELKLASGRALSDSEEKIQNWLLRNAQNMRGLLPGLPDVRVPVLKPDDDAASGKLESILMSTRAGVRIDVTEAKHDTSKPIGCPYVEDKNPKPQHRAEQYLRNLRTQSIKALEDPDANNSHWPLLYRLARVSLERNTFNLVAKNILAIPERAPIVGRLTDNESNKLSEAKQQTDQLTVEKLGAASNVSIRGLNTEGLKLIRTANKQFAEALSHLESVTKREQGIAELEMLLVEVIDLFQHRIDAIATGLAYARIKRNRDGGQKGLNLGYFAMLSKLRTKSVHKNSNSYIQAPSQPQATTAAVLRSAYLRHKAEGAFEINLSSSRVLRALEILDLLSKGHSLAEALGMRGERWLHNSKLDKHIYPIREKFPIKTASAGTSARRMFDGLALVDSSSTNVGGFNINALRLVLAESLDTLSDLVMAEATHQRAIGQSGAANAWLQVLSGGTPPGVPSVVRTQRHGHATDYRVSVLMAQGSQARFTSVRQIGEPSLATLVSAALTGIDTAQLSVRAVKQDGSLGPAQLVALKRHLRFSSMDMVIGGWEELEALTHAYMLNRLQKEPELLNTMQAGNTLAEFESGIAKFIITAHTSGPNASTLAVTAREMRRTVLRSRALEATDLNAAADALEGQLVEEERISAEEFACAELLQRVQVLNTQLNTGLNGVSGQPGLRQFALTYQSAVNAYISALDSSTGNPEIQRDAAMLARANLSDHQLGLVFFGCRAALHLPILSNAITDPDAEFARLDRLVAELEQKRAVLEAATGTAVSGFASYAEAKTSRVELIKAIQFALDGDGFVILPPVRRASNNVKPVLGSKQTVTAALSDWIDTRLPVGDAVNFASNITSVKAAKVKSDAWDDERGQDPVDRDARPENVAPRTEHHATFIAQSALLSNASTVAGMVVDEWVDQRPAESQEAALAVNYDTPQAEPPNVTLLCTPPEAGFKRWSEEDAANMVSETITWMKIRALNSEDRIVPRGNVPFFNDVAYKNPKIAKSKRIPTAKSRFLDTTWMDAGGRFKSVSTISVSDIKSPQERDGYRYNKE